jgi:hypothetical protein
MNKKYIHFFGCSFTVGHELPDDEMLPWAKDCKTSDEYYKTFSELNNHPTVMTEYITCCKSMAYPKIIEENNPDWESINHAELGSSIKQEVYKIISLIEKKEERIDFIILQVPHFTREFAVNSNEELKTYSINYPMINDAMFNEYLEKSVMFHSINHWTLLGLMDLLLLQGYLLSKNIKFLFIDLEGSNRDVWHDINFWTPEEKYCLNLQWDGLGRTIGNHFNLKSHQNFARILSEKIKETL